jgi:hypothetical protein
VKTAAVTANAIERLPIFVPLVVQCS